MKLDTLKTIEWHAKERDVELTEEQLKTYIQTSRLWSLKPYHYVGYAILPGQRYEPGQEVYEIISPPKELGYDYEGRSYAAVRNGLVYSDTMEGARTFLPNGIQITDRGLVYVKIIIDNPKAKVCRSLQHINGSQEYFTDRYTVAEICDGLINEGDSSPENHTQFWFKDGLLHRPISEGPAVYDTETTREYWTEGQLADMIDNEPSYVSPHSKMWTKDGVLHRDHDLPALVDDLDSYWYTMGVLNRTPFKPAVTGTNTKYYVNGERYHEGKPDTRDQIVDFSRTGDLIVRTLCLIPV